MSLIIINKLNSIETNILNIDEADYVQCLHCPKGIIHQDGHIYCDNIHYCFDKWYHKKTIPLKISYEYANESVLSLIQVWNNLFQHITFDTLPKIPIINEITKKYNCKILCMNNTQKNMIRKYIDLPDDRFLIRKENISYITRESFYINFINSKGKKICMGSCGYGIIANLIPDLQSNSNTIVYISRGNAKYRNVINENTVLKNLYMFSKDNRMELKIFVNPNGKSDELLTTLRHCKFFISPHGGAMGNIIYCNKQTNVIEFISLQKLNERPCFYYLSNALGLSYKQIEPISFDFNGKIEVNVDVLIDYLNTFKI